MAVVALGNLAQFVLQTGCVLYTSSVSIGDHNRTVGHFSPSVSSRCSYRTCCCGVCWPAAARLATIGMLSGALCLLARNRSTAGWLMYVIIVRNFLGFTVTPTIQSIISNAADAETQGRIMGAVASLTSLASVFAPAIAGRRVAFAERRLASRGAVPFLRGATICARDHRAASFSRPRCKVLVCSPCCRRDARAGQRRHHSSISLPRKSGTFLNSNGPFGDHLGRIRCS